MPAILMSAPLQRPLKMFSARKRTRVPEGVERLRVPKGMGTQLRSGSPVPPGCRFLALKAGVEGGEELLGVLAVGAQSVVVDFHRKAPLSVHTVDALPGEGLDILPAPALHEFGLVAGCRHRHIARYERRGVLAIEGVDACAHRRERGKALDLAGIEQGVERPGKSGRRQHRGGSSN